MATSGQKSRTGAKSAGNRSAQRRRPHQDETGIIPVLARVVRGIENAADRGKVNAANRVRYRVVAVLAREERTRIKIVSCATHNIINTCAAKRAVDFDCANCLRNNATKQ